jgi:HEAT repeat protein
LELLQQLAKDEYFWVRGAVASNPNTPLELLQQLAKDEDLWVRKEVAENPNTPAELLQQLAKDEDSDARREVAKNPNTPVELRLELLQQLAKDEKWAVRREVARNPNTPGELLQQLAKDESSDVRGDVARNPNTPLEAYFYLRLDKNQSVRDSAIGSLSGLQPEQQSCLKELATPFLLQECTKGSPPSLPRLIAMLHPEYPVPALARHFRSSDWRERCAIAQNPSTPPNTLAILAREGNRVVRAAAKENLAGQEQA